jgi:hypothetical protein
MKPNDSQDSITASAASGPLTDLVDDKLNNSLTDQIVEEIEEKRDRPARSGANDYAHGTVEHDDDSEG